MQESEFKKLVQSSLEDLPEHIAKHLDNVAVTVAQEPNGHQLKKLGTRKGGILLGLYEGIPKTIWGRGFGNNLPDKITIFQKSIEMFAKTPQQIETIARNTVWHEIAHHFGYNDEGIKQLERKKQSGA